MGPGKIETLHYDLNAKFKKILNKKVWIGQVPGIGNWKDANIGRSIQFQLISKDVVESEWAMRPDGSQKVPVFALYETSDPDDLLETRHWVSWYERWEKTDRSEFKLHTMSWTVFRGTRYTPEKAPVLRADWDQLRNTDASREAGHPHWHLLEPVLAEERTSGSFPTASLKELKPVRHGTVSSGTGVVGIINLDRLHLAMGAWDPDKPHPTCWQRSARSNREVREWAVRTLQYLCDQFAQF